jgi:hypothetical protein
MSVRATVGAWVAFASILALAGGWGCGESSSESRRIVSVSGRIGPLRIDESDRAAVIAFAGRPDAERDSHGSARYTALGYDCGSKSRIWNFPLRPYPDRAPNCRTVFWLDVPTGKLANFFTSDSRYVEEHGVRIGMATARAERLLRKRVFQGCEQNVYLPSPKAFSLTIAFNGAVPHPRKSLHVIGGHVFAFVLHSRRHDTRVFDCL